MREQLVLEHQSTTCGKSDLYLQKACAEIRRCHRRVDKLLAANNLELGRRCAARLRAMNAKCCQALLKAAVRALRVFRERGGVAV